MNPYVDPNTRVNFNRLGITDSRVLQVAEYQATAIRIQELDLAPIAGDFGLEHWRAVHKHIFQDVYDWAGKPKFDTNPAKSLICLEASMRRATTARTFERRARAF